MNKYASARTKHRAWELRQNMTAAEMKLWQKLRAHQLEDTHFRRQHAIGQYIVDFCAPKRKLVIELDGDPHQDQQTYDDMRTKDLQNMGYVVLRFWNREVFENMGEVIKKISDTLHENEIF
jgi:very-short-patch-repair endonuclease